MKQGDPVPLAIVPRGSSGAADLNPVHCVLCKWLPRVSSPSLLRNAPTQVRAYLVLHNICECREWDGALERRL